MGYRGNGGDRPPENDLIQEIIDGFEGLKRELQGRKDLVLMAVVAAIILMGGVTSFYTVQPTEEAVVVRLGKYLETTLPGLHFKIPFGIDRVTKVSTKLILQEEFGFRSRSQNRRANFSSPSTLNAESSMLTGDLNVADVEWIVQFKISEPRKFLFLIRSPITTLRDVSQAMMRRVVGDRLVSDVLTTGRVEIAASTKVLMQEVLDKYDIGIRIVAVKLQGRESSRKREILF